MHASFKYEYRSIRGLRHEKALNMYINQTYELRAFAEVRNLQLTTCIDVDFTQTTD